MIVQEVNRMDFKCAFVKADLDRYYSREALETIFYYYNNTAAIKMLDPKAISDECSEYTPEKLWEEFSEDYLDEGHRLRGPEDLRKLIRIINTSERQNHEVLHTPSGETYVVIIL